MIIGFNTVNEIYKQQAALSEEFKESPELKDAVKDVVGVLKKHGCTFDNAKRVLIATGISLDNTMISRLITPKKESTAELESAVDSVE